MATEKGVSLTGVCRQLGYSKQAYYQSLSRQKRVVDQSQQIKAKVLSIRHQLPRLGTRKLYQLLQSDIKERGWKLGRDGLFRLMRQASLLVSRRRQYVRTTDSRGWMRQYADLAKNLPVVKPEQLWVADITYLTTRQNPIYLHLVTDAYSKRIMGYHLSDHLGAGATAEALKMALRCRQYTGKLIHHSDRGLQYSSKEYTQLLKDHQIDISMTQTGSPYDNAIAERVNGILKQEFGLDYTLKTINQAQSLTDQAIALYNGLRPHMSNHFLTPDQMHAQDKLKPRKWHKKKLPAFEN